MARILVVEDSTEVRELLRETLAAEGHAVTLAADGLAARSLLAGTAGAPGTADTAGSAGAPRNADSPGGAGVSTPPFELVVLDLMLPQVDGSVLLAEIRRATDMPVLVLSAKDAVFTKVDMLRLGADDYVTKPFDLTELAARIAALLRRSSPAASTPTVLRHGPLVLDGQAARVHLHDREVVLTSTELRILQLLMEHPDTVFSRPRIYEAIWEAPFVGDDAAVKTHLSNLRTKLRGAAEDTDPIETVWGLGYRLRADTRRAH